DISGRAGVFADKNVGTSKSVTVSGYAISGADAANYALVQPTGVTADITALSLAVTGATAANKVYDQLTTATISGGAIAPILGDTVTLDISGRAGVFGDKNVGTSKSVAVSGYTISGADAANYTLVQPTGVTADITALSLAVTGVTASNKTYDALLGATISGGTIAPISGDDVTLDISGRAGVFGDKNVGASKSVTVSGYTISGADAANYSLVQATGVTADIVALALDVTGAQAANKIYDALLGASITGGTVTPLSGDTVVLDGSARVGQFSDKNAGSAKTVTVSGYVLTGADAGNYALIQPTGLTADITARVLAVTGAIAANKTYDAQLAAAISGGVIAPIAGDDVTLDISGRAGVFGDKNVGVSKGVTVSGYAISGADAANYSLAQPNGLTADITALSLAVTGVSVADKIRDGNRNATLSGGSVAAIAGDDVTLDVSGAVGLFADDLIGLNKPVFATGYVLTGTDAFNYDLLQPTGLTANITDSGILYPIVEAVPAPVFLEPAPSLWSPPAVTDAAEGPVQAVPQIQVSPLGVVTTPPDIVPVGRMLSLNITAATPIAEVSIEFLSGFVPGDTVFQFEAPEGLSVSTDSATGKLTIKGQASPSAYERLLKSLAVRSASGGRVGDLTLRIGLGGAGGGKRSATVQLRKSETVSAR
ncbi:MAG: YDG domain-containing protein, partial [Opitutales bacterium]